MDAPTESLPELAPAHSLETIELELALQSQDTVQNGFEGAVRQALARTGGVLLFHMRMEDDAGAPRWTAAVAMGNGEDRQFFIVSIPADGAVRIEPLAQSDEPLARIAPAFADVMERLHETA